MSATVISSKSGVRSRRVRRCDLCGGRIEQGALQDVRTGVSDDGWFTMRMHPECHQYEGTPAISRELRDAYWYEDCVEPAFDRADAIVFSLSTP